MTDDIFFYLPAMPINGSAVTSWSAFALPETDKEDINAIVFPENFVACTWGGVENAVDYFG